MAHLYSSRAGGDHNVQVTDKLYLQTQYMDSIWMAIDSSALRNNSSYRYSDLGFYYMARIVKAVSGKELDDYMRDRFYAPLGLYNMDFNPRERFSLARIVPSEVDNYWRKQPVHGYVHDMGAAMLGGVSGHAGLFGNAHDLAILGQLWLQRGIYGNHVYLKPEVVREFTRRYPSETRRGLGFDMKQLDYDKSQNVSHLAGEKVFGHLGFTGTCIWADPDEELLFIFLSNRTYPSMHNAKLGNMQIRPRLQSVVYKSITHSLMKVPIVLPLETKALPGEVVSGE
jgi:CubicO group peptidase (beta-lactamase class C family)